MTSVESKQLSILEETLILQKETNARLEITRKRRTYLIQVLICWTIFPLFPFLSFFTFCALVSVGCYGAALFSGIFWLLVCYLGRPRYPKDKDKNKHQTNSAKNRTIVNNALYGQSENPLIKKMKTIYANWVNKRGINHGK